LISHFTKKGTKPPIAILAYTDAMPVRTLVYPLARYSPEYQALKWANDNDVQVEFIDLPSDIFLGLQDLEAERLNRRGEEHEGDTETSEENGEPAAAAEPADLWRPERGQSIYERIAQRSNEPDYDTYLERRFQPNLADDSYRLSPF